MAGSQGYSLEQLLAWTLEDSLIDGYERSGDLLVIVQGTLRREIPFREAGTFLKGMFRNHPGPLAGRPPKRSEPALQRVPAPRAFR